MHIYPHNKLFSEKIWKYEDLNILIEIIKSSFDNNIKHFGC